MAIIKNIIFDLGGVLINIDYYKTINAFEELGYKDFEKNFSQYQISTLFEDLETGKISDDAFFDEMIRLNDKPVTKAALNKAWNAMLLNFRADSLPVLERLATRYKLYLLSNTNHIHLEEFEKIFTRDTGKARLQDYFTKVWYSHEIGLRKPHAETYAFALKDGNMPAEETLFIDDTRDNIAGAAALGIQTHLLLPTETIQMLDL